MHKDGNRTDQGCNKYTHYTSVACRIRFRHLILKQLHNIGEHRMSVAQTLLSWIKPNIFYIVVVVFSLALAFKLYFNAFSRSIFVSLQNRRLKTVLQRSGNTAAVAIPASTTAISYAENQKVL